MRSSKGFSWSRGQPQIIYRSFNRPSDSDHCATLYFLITIHFIPDDPDIMRLLDLLPETSRMDSLELTLSSMILNYILPVFFLVIPIMTASIMAASAFVGEKERHTLETLLYCPLTLKQIFRAKVWASFLLSMLVSLITFVAMFLVIETELFSLWADYYFPVSAGWWCCCWCLLRSP